MIRINLKEFSNKLNDKKDLISLDEYNKQREHIYLKRSGNGIECPSCGDELFDESNEILTSYPPKQRIKCKSCNWSGFKIF